MAAKQIYCASDHGGIVLKDAILSHLQEMWYACHDLGANGTNSVDYPDFGALLAQALKKDPDGMGIAICGSGIGISIAANRHSWVRAALVHDSLTAKLARQHNDANVIALGERTMGVLTAIECVDIFLDTPFEGGRHQRRVDKLTSL